MIDKKDFKQICKRELLSFKITFLQEKKLSNSIKNNITSSYHLDSYLDHSLLLLNNIFFKINSLLVNIKYKILENKGNNIKKIVDNVLGKNNGNNIFSLIKFIENNSTIIFDKDFIFYISIIETLVRHQVSHGFGKCLIYFLNADKNEFLLFHNKEKWDKYIEEEGNQNVFFLMSSFLFDKVDFMDSLHVSSQLMSLLNSFSARKFAQLTLMQRNHSNIYSKLILDKFKNHNLVTDIVIHKYEESWGVLDNKLKRIENKKLEIMHINSFNAHNKQKNLKLLNNIEYTLKLNMEDLFIFENFGNCKFGTKCVLCKNFSILEYKNIMNSNTYMKELRKQVTKINKNKAKKIFEIIIKKKISNLPPAIKRSEKNYNEYFENIMKEFFGNIIIPQFNYYINFGKDLNNDDINKNINNFFNNCSLIGIKQFLCYKFMDNDFIPLEIKKRDIIINEKDDIVINPELFLKKIKKEFFRIYKTKLI